MKAVLRREFEKLKVENADIDIIKKSYLDMKLVVENKNDEVSRLSDAVTLLSNGSNILLTEMERPQNSLYAEPFFFSMAIGINSKREMTEYIYIGKTILKRLHLQWAEL